MVNKALSEYFIKHGWETSKQFPSTLTWFKDDRQINIINEDNELKITLYFNGSFLGKYKAMGILVRKIKLVAYFIES